MRFAASSIRIGVLVLLATSAGADLTGTIILSPPNDALGPINDPALRGRDLEGYVVEEFFVEGLATVYNYRTDPAVRGDVVPIEEQTNLPYKTRLIVRRPVDPEDFNGTAVVEWWNSTAGFDTSPSWDSSAPYFGREGFVYLGWTNARGFGDPSDPEYREGPLDFLIGGCAPPGFSFTSCGTRYESLAGQDGRPVFLNGQAYEVGSQIANALKNGPNSPLPDDYAVERVFHAGFSQQGGSMVTYASAFHRLDESLNDGYFVQAAGTARPINFGPVCGEDGSLDFPDCTPQLEGEQRLVRRDLSVPVYRVHTETDLAELGVLTGDARQDDAESFRYYEMTGTAHTAVHVDVMPFGLPVDLQEFCLFPVNSLADGPVFGAFLLNAMWDNMRRQAEDDVAPPAGALVETEGDVILRDGFGNALGGIRLPELDVPLASYGPSNEVDPTLAPALQQLGALFCRLSGKVTPFDPQTLDMLYPEEDDFLTAYAERVHDLVDTRFLLPEDAEILVAMAAPEPCVRSLQLTSLAGLVLLGRLRATGSRSRER